MNNKELIKQKSNIMENRYVIVRADAAGVFFGKLVSKNGQEVELKDVRKLHYWDGAAAVEEIAMIGTKNPDKCRFTVTVPSMIIDGVCQTIPCNEDAINSIKSVLEWKA
jgi:hypothetical protein